jgi:hypothetical protein
MRIAEEGRRSIQLSYGQASEPLSHHAVTATSSLLQLQSSFHPVPLGAFRTEFGSPNYPPGPAFAKNEILFRPLPVDALKPDGERQHNVYRQFELTWTYPS